MLFVIEMIYKTKVPHIEEETRQRHQQYLRSASQNIRLAGPLLSGAEDTQEKAIGTHILIEAASYGAVQLFIDNDPYLQAGLYEKTHIRLFKPYIGSWLK